ncbi:MAG: glycosyltransferase family 2 protein [Planctomycetales bacterium]|nr:glycosyltransferase family 2 protein [Planctomycetales bacterium]
MANSDEASETTVPDNTTPLKLEDVWVVIPARNEEASLPWVLGDLPPVGRVIVADNGSTDTTANIARVRGANVVGEERRGYGAACLAGLAEIRRRVQAGEPPPRVVVFLDADYSDHPDLLPLLVEPILRGDVDFVLGSRLLSERESGAMPPQSVYGNKLACWLMRLLWRARYTDLGPFRAIGYPALLALDMRDRNFGWTVEMQIKATVAGLRTLEIPVPYRRRIGQSKISGTISGTIKAGAKILFTIAKYGWQTRWTR